MTLYQRLKRRLGYDTTVTESRTIPIYEYTIRHLNGNVNEVVGHGYDTDGAFATFYEYTDVDVYQSVLGGPHYSVCPDRKQILRRLEGIEEIKREQVGETYLEAVIDGADNSVVSKTFESDAFMEA